MTVEELQDEIGAIDAIYPDTVIPIAPQIYTFKIPQHESLSIQLNFPSEYPEEIPQLLQVLIENNSRFTDVNYLEKHINEILSKVYIPEQVVMFEFLTELQEFLINILKNIQNLHHHQNKNKNPYHHLMIDQLLHNQ